MNSSRFSASRIAEVATKRISSASRLSIMRLYSRTAASVRSIASGASRPVRSTPCPRRTMRIWRVKSLRAMASPLCTPSATRSRIEFVPQSIAATRVMISFFLSRIVSQQVQAAVSHRPRSRIISSARSPIGFTPRPAAKACPTSACRHLTRVGMPPAETP